MTAPASVVALAGRSIRIEANSARAHAAVGPALAHLVPATEPAGRETLWRIVEEPAAWRPSGFPAAGAYRMPSNALAIVQDDPASFESYHPETGIELRATASGFAAGDLRAHPACHALAAWLNTPSTQVCHAAAVAHDGAAALLVGAGGAGKSTTALACAIAGADYLGDDLVLVEPGGVNGEREPAVHALFATAKLNADSARAVGAGAWPRLGVTPKRKDVFAVGEKLRVVRSAQLVTMIVLSPSEPGRSQPARIPIPKLVGAMAPMALPLAWRAGTPATWLATAASLARRLPAYCLPVNWDLDGLAAAVREIIARAAG
jgi:hypothetical protein